MTNKETLKLKAFTIVELLVVIVVIGILAAITIVGYTGVSKKAVEASLKSDLSNATKRLEMYKVDYGYYPDSIDSTTHCPSPSDPKYCLSHSGTNTLTYTPTGSSNIQAYSLDSANGTNTYFVTNNSGPAIGSSVPTVTIGTQTWMKYNINTGTMVSASGTNQTNTQKWCYSNLESNCTTYGGLYQWNTVMQGSTTEGTQGICPIGFHVPSDTEWYTLENYLDSTINNPSATGLRGIDGGAKLKSGGGSGFDALLGGGFAWGNDGSFQAYNVSYFWTSTMSSGDSWLHGLNTVHSKAMRYTGGNIGSSRTTAVSMRCIKS